MIDEIKRAEKQRILEIRKALELNRKGKPESRYLYTANALSDLDFLLNIILAERRKAYEECARILQIKLWREIAKEISRRMEGVC